MKARTITLALIMLIISVGLRAADDPQTGAWKLNVAKSKFSPGPPPKSQAVTIEPYGKDGVKLALEVLNPQGEKLTVQYSASYDGKEYPRTEAGAGAVSGQTVTLKRIDAHTVERIAYLGGKKLTTERWVISQDGKTRTVTQTGTNPQGQQVNIVMVYEKH
jgi:hypothetical protein